MYSGCFFQVLCPENIHKSIVKIYKSNDITVNSVESLVNDYFSNDTRGVSGKKILIIGVGNIGSKIALRLVETGANISLFRISFTLHLFIIHNV